MPEIVPRSMPNKVTAYIFIAGGGRSGMRTMPIVIARGDKETIIATNGGNIAIEKMLGADQLVRAGKRRRAISRGRTSAAPTCRRGRIAAIIGKGRVLGPDAGVDDTNDDPFPFGAHAGHSAAIPDLVGADKGRGNIRMDLAPHITLDSHDTGLFRYRRCLCRRQGHGQTIEGYIVIGKWGLLRGPGPAPRRKEGGLFGRPGNPGRPRCSALFTFSLLAPVSAGVVAFNPWTPP